MKKQLISIPPARGLLLTRANILMTTRVPNEKSLYRNGELLITNRRDISGYVVDLQDDKVAPFTSHSVVLY